MFGRPHRTPVCTRVGQNGQLVYEVLRGYGQAPFYTGNISRTFSLRLGDCRGIEAPWISLLSDIINKREFVNFTMLAQVIIYNCNLPPQCNLRFCFLLDGVLEYGQLPIWVMQMILISHDLRNLMRFALHVILSIYLILPNQLLDMSRPFTTKVSLIIPLIH